MASSSSCGNYEVFLNFRGEDTRKSFTCYLYDKLYEGKKIKTFIDDEGLRRGDEISPALLYAIQGSKISVVIFSKDYASSKWCLNELVKILECKNTNGQIIIPVFYGVSPSDVRHQNGTFGDRFDELKKQFKDKPEMVQKWRDALTETSHLAGHESTKFRLDAQLVNKIVEDVLKKLEKITVSTDSSNGLVGLNSRIEQIKPFLCMDLWDTVQIVGIWGTGGIGKTTLAEAIFDQFSGEFDGKYFAKNVRRKSETEGGLEDLQKEMLSTILSEKLEVAGPNIPQFTKGRVRRMKVLIVLDDVNKDEQLEGLIGGLDQYGPGSRIVVTTRDKRVLEKFGVEKIYRVNGLRLDEAFEHFCNFAFKENHCPEDLNRHSRRVQSIFLDIACFFEGGDKDFLARILDDSESDGLDVLIDKSLISISGDSLQMHDILQEMGRQIVRQESEKEPGKRSRLWDPKEIRRVLKHNKLPNGLDYLPKKLRYLHWDTYPLRTLPSNFKPKNLVALNLSCSKVEQLWEGEKEAFKLKSINLSHSQHFIKMPGPFETPNVETYLLDYTNLACVPSSIQNFKYLSALSFEGCKSLRSFPSNLHFVCPVTINFSYCVNLIEFPLISGKVTSLNLSKSAIEEVPSSIECLTDLKKLNLKYCKRLKRISTRFCKLRSLVDLFLNGCVNLERFPEILEKMEHLERINLNKTAITELPSSFENLPGLEELFVEDCSKLDKLPDNIGNLKCLFIISAVGSAISQLPSSSVAYSNRLGVLYFSRCKGLVSLPRSFLLGLAYLGHLDMRNCAVMEIPQEIACLSSLTTLNLSGNSFESLPASIKQLSQLRSLHLEGCKMLQSLPELPLCLESLDLTGCNMLRSLPELPLCLHSLNATNCNRLQSLPEIPSCLQELDASVLEKLSKPSPDLCEWHPEYRLSQPIYFRFTNCLKLDGKANNKILADSLRMAIAASLRRGKTIDEKLSELRRSQIVLPGSKIPDWFSNQSSGSSIRIQLPPHSFCRNLIGFAFCAVLDFKQLYSDRFRNVYVGCRSDLEIKTLSETKHVHLSFDSHSIEDLIDSDHVILGFKPCLNVGFPDGYHHTTVSLKFFNECCRNLKVQKGQKIKRCGVCPVYANPSEIKANTFTLNFATEVWKLDDLPSASGTAASEFDSSSDEGELYYSFDEEELEPSPKRICRADQINTS
ncbi:ADP-ribosyl cyclase/cyclic ADP-ribose hydrolase [Citrus sinensis]|uniref:ADP-ribosyl cyclase/cyclic ADP-ribose hydrolase n=1 Tax=Citrus sinensis TaxID=2711 RepID=A0ACB8MBT1_CITSI|nr:ADP-ribosyl cyclase/cyclic ADP-ribose hydrolase [Citrus sinensis]